MPCSLLLTTMIIIPIAIRLLICHKRTHILICFTVLSNCLGQWSPKFSGHQDHLKNMLKEMAGIQPQNFFYSRYEWGEAWEDLKIHISNKFPVTITCWSEDHTLRTTGWGSQVTRHWKESRIKCYHFIITNYFGLKLYSQCGNLQMHFEKYTEASNI